MHCQGVVGVIDERILIPGRPALDQLQACSLSPSGKQSRRAPVGHYRKTCDEVTRRPQMVSEVFKGPSPRLRNHEVDHIAGHQHDVECAAELDDADVTLDPRHRRATSPGCLQHLAVQIDAHDIDTPAEQLPTHPTRATAGVEDAGGRKAHDEIGFAMDVLTSGSSQLVGALIPISPAESRLHALIFVDLAVGLPATLTDNFGLSMAIGRTGGRGPGWCCINRCRFP